MWVLAIPPLVAGIVLVVFAGLMFFAEVAGKLIVAMLQLAWHTVNSAR